MTAERWQAAPPGYMAVVSLDELANKELAVRRAALLRALGCAPGGAADGVLAAALALAAVTLEQDQRAKAYADHRGTPYRCTCGYLSLGLEAMDSHLDGHPGEASHEEA